MEGEYSKGIFDLDIEEMARVGMHFGHRISKTHPKMLPFIFGLRNGIHIIDLEKARERFIEALKTIYEFVKENKRLLVVGTFPPLREIVKAFAIETNLPFIVYRWIGGTFTNFPQIKSRIEYLKSLQTEKESGGWSRYTKKERKILEEKIKKLEERFGGLRELEDLPDGVFVCNMVENALAVKEAKRKKIKIFAICCTNANPELADVPIIGNDHSTASVGYILERVKKVIFSAREAKNGN